MSKGDKEFKIEVAPEVKDESIPVTLSLPGNVHRILSEQAKRMGLTLEEFMAGLVDLGYETLEADGGARAYKS